MWTCTAPPECWHIGLPKPIDNVGLLRPARRKLVQAADRCYVLKLFDSDDRHAHILLRRRFGAAGDDVASQDLTLPPSSSPPGDSISLIRRPSIHDRNVGVRCLSVESR